jgi:hypothetical protein
MLLSCHPSVAALLIAPVTALPSNGKCQQAVLKDIFIMLAPMLLVLLAIVSFLDVLLYLPRLVTESGFK